jgi:hypothetical protein
MFRLSAVYLVHRNRDAEVLSDALVQLFFLSWSGLIGSRDEYEGIRLRGCLSGLEPSNERRTNRTKKL